MDIPQQTKQDYMLLARLKQDCEYYLGFGDRRPKHLWALDEKEQIAKMRELHASVPEKPEWLTTEEIDAFEKEMVCSPQAHLLQPAC